MTGTRPIAESTARRKFRISSDQRVALRAIPRRCKNFTRTGVKQRAGRSRGYASSEDSRGAILTACLIRTTGMAVHHPISLAVACTKQRVCHARTMSSRHLCGTHDTRDGISESILSLRILAMHRKPALAGHALPAVLNRSSQRFRRCLRTATKALCTAMSPNSF